MRVSVITAVFNRATTIEETINSLLIQKYDNIEYIIIDGGSSDGTKEIIERYRHVIDVFISEPDKGIYEAINKGIKLATGDIIGLLHSDDIFYDQNTIPKIVSAFCTSKADLVYANGIYVDQKKPNEIQRVYRGKKFNHLNLYLGWIPLHTTIFVKKEIFEKYGLYREDYFISSDYEISLRWFKNEKIGKYYLNEYVIKMRLGGKSTALRFQNEKSHEDMQIIKENNLLGVFTLLCKILRKIPQYIIPRVMPKRAL